MCISRDPSRKELEIPGERGLCVPKELKKMYNWNFHRGGGRDPPPHKCRGWEPFFARGMDIF